MTAIYNSFRSNSYDGDCGICRYPVKNTDAVAHTGLGNLHPLHRECAKSAARINNMCPYGCNTKIDTSSLFTWKDKCVTELKCMSRDAVLGLCLEVISTLARAQGIVEERTFRLTLGTLTAGVLEVAALRTLREAGMTGAESSEIIVIMTTAISTTLGLAAASGVVGIGVGAILTGFIYRRWAQP